MEKVKEEGVRVTRILTLTPLSILKQPRNISFLVDIDMFGGGDGR